MLKLLALAGFMFALAAPVYAQAQPDVQLDQIPQLNPIAGAPTVAITKLDLFKPTNLSSAGIEWSVQKPTLTQITRFDVSFEVTYEPGKTQELSKSIMDGGARSVTFNNLPGFPVRKTATRLITTFTTPGVLTETEDFTIGSAPPTPPRPKPLDITQVNSVTQGCGAGQSCFEVKWGASTNVPSLQSFNSFNVKLDVKFSNGAIVSGSATASGSERQKIIAVSRPQGSFPQTAKATLNAAVTLRGNISVGKQTP